jgi:hypothetical protein
VLFACIHACDFACSACGSCSPLATIELEGKVECMGCGLTQAFDAVQWSEALTHAHDVTDLSGSNPEGQTPRRFRHVEGQALTPRAGATPLRAGRAEGNPTHDAANQ